MRARLGIFVGGTNDFPSIIGKKGKSAWTGSGVEKDVDFAMVGVYLLCRYGRLSVQTKIQKWGNSLAVRIPKAFVKEAHVAYGTTVDLSVDDGKLVIDPRVESEYRLEDLLKGVTKGTRHAEVETGKAVGREVW